MIVVGPVKRKRINAASFAALTDATYVRVVPRDEEGPGGIEFADDLTAEEQSDVWWWMTSESDADEAKRRNIRALLFADDPGLCAELVSYVLGEVPG